MIRNRRKPFLQRVLVAAAACYTTIGLSLAAEAAIACPFCAASSQTLGEEMESSDVAVIAKLVEKAERKPNANVQNTPLEELRQESKFELVEILKGEQHLGDAKFVEVFHFGESKLGTPFLIMGMALPDAQWTTPVPLSSRAVDYVSQLLALPTKGPDRLLFFQQYLEDEDPLLAQDAYDEFARAPYQDVIGLKGHMNHDKLVEWIQDYDVSPSHRRLYLTMLGVCGTKDDIPMLKEMMTSDDRRAKAGLDALIGCFLTLKGPEGMPVVEDLFLKNKDAEYGDTYGAIMALRILGQESDVIPRERLLVGLRYMLDRPDLADLVIPDLARWEDWAVMDRLVKLFKDAEDSSSFVRVPVVNYLLAASRQKGEVRKKAKAALDELTLIDPDSVKRARSYAAFGALAGGRRPSSKPSGDKKQDPLKKTQDANGQKPAKEAAPEKETEPEAAGDKSAAANPAANVDQEATATASAEANPEHVGATPQPESAGTAAQEGSKAAAESAAAQPAEAPAERGEQIVADGGKREYPAALESVSATRVTIFVVLAALLLLGIRLHALSAAESGS